ncbi:MAG: phosphonate ABC transporter substrate-binding protein [Alphaproteobacteria bacterium]|nr:phosphonate ABC transporter substrate-binding protein [Alphaproteobacteria bacterium]
MIRRSILVAAIAAMLPAVASAQSWKAKYPELLLSIVPAENASGVTQRFEPFIEYLSREIGTKIVLRIATDYAAVIEGQKAGSIHIATYGPSSYVRAWTVTNGGVEPFNTTINSDGSVGYYSVAYARSRDAGTRIEDFRGRNLCLVDANSTSGNNVPRFAMSKQGIEPEKFFGKVVYAGSHENAVTALIQGTCDIAFNWWNSETDSNLTRMANKKLVSAGDVKTVFRSDLIMGSPNAYLASLPADLKAAITKAFEEAPTKARAAFDRLSDGKDLGFRRVTHKDYEPVVELQKFVDELRRKRAS